MKLVYRWVSSKSTTLSDSLYRDFLDGKPVFNETSVCHDGTAALHKAQGWFANLP